MLPTPGSPTVLIDSGANPDCKPEYFPQFALMGSVVAEVHFGLDRPRVGLLNIGQERGKGRELERAAFELLEATPVNFIGNVEGAISRRTPSMCWSPTGSPATSCSRPRKGRLSSLRRWPWMRWPPCRSKTRSEFSPFSADCGPGSTTRRSAEPTSLARRGSVVIAHGTSSSVAIANAIALAADGADRDLVKRLADRVA